MEEPLKNEAVGTGQS